MASTARLGALLLAISLSAPVAGRDTHYTAQDRLPCDHACWMKVCAFVARTYHASYDACMRDERRP